MLKKLLTVFVIILAASCTFMLSGCSDQDDDRYKMNEPELTTKSRAARSVIHAAMYNKVELFWNCLSPNTQKRVKEVSKGDLEKTKKAFFEKFNKDFQKLMSKHQYNQKKIMAEMFQDNSIYPLRKIENLWYLDLDGILIKKKEPKAVVRSSANHTSKETLGDNFLSGVFASNYNLVWDCLSPEMQKKIKEERRNKRVDLHEIKRSFVNRQKPAIEKLLKKHNYDAEKAIAEFIKTAPLVQINDKWYYQTK